MIDYFDNLYTKIENKNLFLTRIKYYGLLRFLIKITVNGLTPLLYIITKNNRKYYLSKMEMNHLPMVIVSFTSFPARIKRVWLVVESIFRQTKKPNKIILWLSKEQFPTLEVLPSRLLNQQKRGLEIRLVEGDLKSHKKYFYTLHYFPNDIMVTIDDDIFYRSTMIEDLYNYSLRFPLCIISQYCKQMTFTGNVLNPYKSWVVKKKEILQCPVLFFGTGGGTFFPPKSLNCDVLNEDLFCSLTPTADDIWLNAMANLNKTKIIQTGYFTNNLPVLNWNNISLASVNLSLNHNDLYLNAVKDFYKKSKNIDPFCN